MDKDGGGCCCEAKKIDFWTSGGSDDAIKGLTSKKRWILLLRCASKNEEKTIGVGVLPEAFRSDIWTLLKFAE